MQNGLPLAHARTHTHTQMISHPGIRGAITVVYLPSLDEVTALKQTGVMKHDDVLKVQSQLCLSAIPKSCNEWPGYEASYTCDMLLCLEKRHL